jgi:hypothetical protein
MVAVEGRRIEPAAGVADTAVLDEFSRKFRHARAPIQKEARILTAFIRADSPDCHNMAFVLFTAYSRTRNHRKCP